MLKAYLSNLSLAEPFRIAHGASAERLVLRVHGVAEGIHAIGEAPFVPYYKDDPNETLKWFSENENYDLTRSTPSEAPRLIQLALELLRGDWLGKKNGTMLGKQLGAIRITPAERIMGCRSFSIPTDMSAFETKVRKTAEQFKILKLKLGSGDLVWDERIVDVARVSAPSATLFADANGGWSFQQALEMIRRLERRNLAFVEQPIHHSTGEEGWRRLRDGLGNIEVRLFADESAQTVHDLAGLEGLVDGVNVKLLKCGGWTNAAKMMLEARAKGLSVLLGCMIESSIGVTAAAHLAPLADWIDLDGHFYLANDDYSGLTYDAEGNLVMPNRPGIGVVRR